MRSAAVEAAELRVSECKMALRWVSAELKSPFQKNKCSGLAILLTTFRTVFNVVPVALPFFAPFERQATTQTDLGVMPVLSLCDARSFGVHGRHPA